MIIDELVAVLGFDLENEGDLNRFKSGLEGAEKSAQRAARAVGALGVAIGTFAGSIALRAVDRLGEAIGAIPAGAIKVGADFQDLASTLETIEGSSAKAKESLDWVSNFATQTPYELKEVSDAFVRLRSYGLDPMGGLLRSVGDASSAMGKSLMQGVEAVADAVTGENERLKEFGIRASAAGDQITYSWTENGKAMKKTVKKDAIEIQNALMGIFDAKFYGMMEKRSNNFRGILSNISDMWQRFLLKVSDAGWFQWVQDQFKGLLDWFKEMDEDGTLDRWAEGISDLLVGIGDSFASLVWTAGRHARRLGEHLYDIGAAAYRAGDGLVNLVSKITGLDKKVAAVLTGLGLAGTTKRGRAIGKGAAVAIARRFPMVAALLAVDDILTGLKDPKASWIGNLEGGTEALNGVRENWEKLSKAATELADNLGRLFAIDFGTGNLGDRLKNFIGQGLVDFVSEASKEIERLTSAINLLNEVMAEKTGQEPRWAPKNFSESIIGRILGKNGENEEKRIVGPKGDRVVSPGRDGQPIVRRKSISRPLDDTLPDTAVPVHGAAGEPGVLSQALDLISSAGTAVGEAIQGAAYSILGVSPNTGKGDRVRSEPLSERFGRGDKAPALPVNDNADLVGALNRFVAGINAVSGEAAAAKVMADIQQRFDNSVTVGDINTPVSVTINSNNPQGTAAQIRGLAGKHANALSSEIGGLGVNVQRFGGPR